MADRELLVRPILLWFPYWGIDTWMLVTDETAKTRCDVNGIVLLGAARAGVSLSEAAALPRLGLALLAYLLLDCPGARASREDAGAFLWEGVDRARQAG